MDLARRRAENKIFRELHRQLKISYDVKKKDSADFEKIYSSDALDIHFKLYNCTLEVYDLSGTQLISMDCDWNSCVEGQRHRNEKFHKLCNYAEERAREPKEPVEAERYNKRFQDGYASQLQKLKIAVHSMKYAYHKAWYEGQARTY